MKKSQLKKFIREAIREIQLNEALPIQCCNPDTNQPTMYSVPSAAQGCDSLGLTTPPCGGPSDEIAPDLGADALSPADTGPKPPSGDSGDNLQLSNFASHKKTCATQAGMPGTFVNQDASTFISAMETGHATQGCSFLYNRLQMHQDQLATGMYIGTNHPAPGTPMGPLWQAQKQSKVDFLQCIIGKICVAGPKPPGSYGVGPKPVPSKGGPRPPRPSRRKFRDIERR
tara:strand:+ start:585 stop:1268 length:684 start_codon:yes stop_codon:yes gene_type:complete